MPSSYLGENKNAIAEKHAEATENDSAMLSEERLKRFRHDNVLKVYSTFLDYTPFSDEGDRLGGRIAQLVSRNGWITTVVTCLTERERLGGP